jgi:hypothetical protein
MPLKVVASPEGRALLEIELDVTVPEGAPPGAVLTVPATLDLDDLLAWLWVGADGAVPGINQSFPLSADAERQIAENAMARGVVPTPRLRDVVARLDRIAAALKRPPAVDIVRDDAGRIVGMRPAEPKQ